MVAGVAGGLAEHLSVDPALVRTGFAVASLLSGAGILAYLVLWVLLPREGDVPAAAPHAV
jgi:phage shock protein C